MGSLAQLAVASGHRVTGADHNVYPPMSTQLVNAGIELIDGFGADQLALNPDLFVVGNVVSRGNPLMEAILNAGKPYVSGPQWLAEHLLGNKWVLAVAGTHGKTTTATMLAWILDYAGMSPGYLIGGVPANFPTSARLGSTDFFVIEADEYDTAFFDKRSKFVHYRPRTLVINNLEFDHADIFPNLAAIQTQFHHLVRTIPENGLIISPAAEPAIDPMLAMGCWTPRQSTALVGAADWLTTGANPASTAFTVCFEGVEQGQVRWPLTGEHNRMNALSAIAAARHVGVVPELACEALSAFQGVKRRMEVRAEWPLFTLYDDFAHHPTAIASTLEGVRARVGDDEVVAVIEPRSNTMKLGVHRERLAASVDSADAAFWLQPNELGWPLHAFVGPQSRVFGDTQAIVDAVLQRVQVARERGRHLHVVIMSNGGFDGIHGRLRDAAGALLNA